MGKAASGAVLMSRKGSVVDEVVDKVRVKWQKLPDDTRLQVRRSVRMAVAVILLSLNVLVTGIRSEGLSLSGTLYGVAAVFAMRPYLGATVRASVLGGSGALLGACLASASGGILKLITLENSPYAVMLELLAVSLIVTLLDFDIILRRYCLMVYIISLLGSFAAGTEVMPRNAFWLAGEMCVGVVVATLVSLVFLPSLARRAVYHRLLEEILPGLAEMARLSLSELPDDMMPLKGAEDGSAEPELSFIRRTVTAASGGGHGDGSVARDLRRGAVVSQALFRSFDALETLMPDAHVESLMLRGFPYARVLAIQERCVSMHHSMRTLLVTNLPGLDPDLKATFLAPLRPLADRLTRIAQAATARAVVDLHSIAGFRSPHCDLIVRRLLLAAGHASDDVRREPPYYRQLRRGVAELDALTMECRRTGLYLGTKSFRSLELAEVLSWVLHFRRFVLDLAAVCQLVDSTAQELGRGSSTAGAGAGGAPGQEDAPARYEELVDDGGGGGRGAEAGKDGGAPLSLSVQAAEDGTGDNNAKSKQQRVPSPRTRASMPTATTGSEMDRAQQGRRRGSGSPKPHRRSRASRKRAASGGDGGGNDDNDGKGRVHARSLDHVHFSATDFFERREAEHDGDEDEFVPEDDDVELGRAVAPSPTHARPASASWSPHGSAAAGAAGHGAGAGSDVVVTLREPDSPPPPVRPETPVQIGETNLVSSLEVTAMELAQTATVEGRSAAGSALQLNASSSGALVGALHDSSEGTVSSGERGGGALKGRELLHQPDESRPPPPPPTLLHRIWQLWLSLWVPPVEMARYRIKMGVKVGLAIVVASLPALFSVIGDELGSVGTELAFQRSRIWAPLTATMVVELSLGASYMRSWNRLMGTILSCALCFPLLLALSGYLPALGVLLFLVMFGFGLIRIWSAFEYLGTTAAVTGVVLVFGSVAHDANADDVRRTVLARTFSVALGVLVALAVMNLVWPFRATKQLRQELAVTVARLQVAFHRLALSPSASYVAEQDGVVFRRRSKHLRRVCRHLTERVAAHRHTLSEAKAERRGFLDAFGCCNMVGQSLEKQLDLVLHHIYHRSDAEGEGSAQPGAGLPPAGSMTARERELLEEFEDMELSLSLVQGLLDSLVAIRKAVGSRPSDWSQRKRPDPVQYETMVRPLRLPLDWLGLTTTALARSLVVALAAGTTVPAFLPGVDVEEASALLGGVYGDATQKWILRYRDMRARGKKAEMLPLYTALSNAGLVFFMTRYAVQLSGLSHAVGRDIWRRFSSRKRKGVLLLKELELLDQAYGLDDEQFESYRAPTMYTEADAEAEARTEQQETNYLLAIESAKHQTVDVPLVLAPDDEVAAGSEPAAAPVPLAGLDGQQQAETPGAGERDNAGASAAVTAASADPGTGAATSAAAPTVPVPLAQLLIQRDPVILSAEKNFLEERLGEIRRRIALHDPRRGKAESGVVGGLGNAQPRWESF